MDVDSNPSSNAAHSSSSSSTQSPDPVGNLLHHANQGPLPAPAVFIAQIQQMCCCWKDSTPVPGISAPGAQVARRHELRKGEER
ncbi:hypothetical protein C2845_PM11G19930 [Panicum miliaceum]|uniref:Uncharacterized protein n=1 Tax=Panicum miliaceum TaxID=4540 RepID=A0A3L6RP51_PANMI|nr:hypothetical protein C2845_PM11G19930 [Panicum miliaceum]